MSRLDPCGGSVGRLSPDPLNQSEAARFVTTFTDKTISNHCARAQVALVERLPG